MQRDEERDNDQSKPTRPPQEIVDASQPEADVNASDLDLSPEPPVLLSPTGSDLTASSMARSAADLSEPASDGEPPPEAPQEETA